MKAYRFELFLEGPPQQDWLAYEPTYQQRVDGGYGTGHRNDGLMRSETGYGMGWNPIARYGKTVLLDVYRYIQRHRTPELPDAYEIMQALYPKDGKMEAVMEQILTERLLNTETQ
jgi:hypothetical protein